MGTYIQVGVCIDLRVAKEDLARLKITRQEAARQISADLVDLSPFTEAEEADAVCWTLPPEIVERDLVPFLRAEYALLPAGAMDKPVESVLAEIAGAGGYAGIVKLARGRSLCDFQSSRIQEYLPVARRPRVQAEVLVYLVEGKAILEEYGRLFGYVRALIRGQAGESPIAKAVAVYLG